jgi:hypothetical protein
LKKRIVFSEVLKWHVNKTRALRIQNSAFPKPKKKTNSQKKELVLASAALARSSHGHTTRHDHISRRRSSSTATSPPPPRCRRPGPLPAAGDHVERPGHVPGGPHQAVQIQTQVQPRLLVGAGPPRAAGRPSGAIPAGRHQGTRRALLAPGFTSARKP